MPAVRSARSLSFADAPPVANPYNKDPQDLIFDGCHDAIISHAVLPEVSKAGVPESIAKTARVIQPGNTLAQERKNAPRHLKSLA